MDLAADVDLAVDVGALVYCKALLWAVVPCFLDDGALFSVSQIYSES